MLYPSVDVKETAVEITIRHTEPEDYEALHGIMSSPKVTCGTLQLPLPSKDLWRGRLAEPPEGIFSLVAVVEGEVVGNIGLMTQPARWLRRHAGEIGMSVRDDWQGQGIGSALMESVLDLADNWLNLTRIELTVYTDNAPAVALYEKFGFEIEGTHRRYAFRDGEYADVYSMARTRG